MSLVTINLHVHADGRETDRILHEILERLKHMPNITELKAAIAQAVGEEAAEVATRLKALEDRIAELTAGQTITDADRDEILAMVRGIFVPT